MHPTHRRTSADELLTREESDRASVRRCCRCGAARLRLPVMTTTAGSHSDSNREDRCHDHHNSTSAAARVHSTRLPCALEKRISNLQRRSQSRRSGSVSRPPGGLSCGRPRHGSGLRQRPSAHRSRAGSRLSPASRSRQASHQPPAAEVRNQAVIDPSRTNLIRPSSTAGKLGSTARETLKYRQSSVQTRVRPRSFHPAAVRQDVTSCMSSLRSADWLWRQNGSLGLCGR